MKRLAACISLAAMLSVSTAAFAANGTGTADDIYDRTEYSVTDADAAGYRTVLIQNGAGSPVYIDQADGSGFDAAAKFFLKEGPEQGTYTIKYGGTDEEKISKQFYIGADPVNAETQMTAIVEGGLSENQDGTVNAGFMASVNADIQYKSVILKRESDGMYMGSNIDFKGAVSGGGGVIVGVQINNVPEDVYESGIEVWLSTKSVEEYETSVSDTVETTGGAADEDV